MKSEIETFFTEEYDKLVKRISYRAGGPVNAEDVVMESFARALQYSDSYDPRRYEIGAWFNTILNNALRDFKREDRHSGAVNRKEEYGDELDVSMFKREMIHTLQDEMDARNEDQAELLRLYFVLGYSAREVSQVTAYNERSVRQIAYVFKKEMGEKYGEDMCS